MKKQQVVKLNVRQLRSLINEVALSPSLFTNNEMISDPSEKPAVQAALKALEKEFSRAVEMNLLLASKDSYDEATKDFDENEFGRVQEAAKTASDVMMRSVRKALKATWDHVMQDTGQK